MASSQAKRAVVIGGGISGLSAAFEFHSQGWEVDVHEASPRWGGKIHTSPVGEQMVDAGPDAILARAEAGLTLCHELGLGDELTHPISPKPAYLAFGGQLHLLPSGTVLGVPVDPTALDHTSLLSDEGRMRAVRDLELPPPDLHGDVSLGKLCRDRFGDELTDRLIDPLVGGINASDIDRLSLRAAAPLLARAITEHGSLIKGMAALYPNLGATLGAADTGGKRSPVFFSLTSGVATIIERLVDVLPTDRLHLDSPIDHLDQLPATVDAIVVATPAPSAARLLANIGGARHGLSAINYAGVSQVTVALPGQTPLDAAGILFPRTGGTILTASTWFSTKWPHYRNPDVALVRLTSGRFGDERSAKLSDETLTATLLSELSAVFPIEAEPTAVRVQRWPNALPQYEPGHLDRVAEARAAVAGVDKRIRLVGAAYDGIGIPACITSGRQAAKDLIEG